MQVAEAVTMEGLGLLRWIGGGGEWCWGQVSARARMKAVEGFGEIGQLGREG